MTAILTQFGLSSAFLSGLYDDKFTFKQLAQQGDFGHGTFNAIDGEMIAVDGKFYRADVDGHITVVSPDQLTPIATLTHFQPDNSFQLHDIVDYKMFQNQIRNYFHKKNGIYAIRIDATFESLLARSESAQIKPYESIKISIPKLQRTFSLKNTQGSLIGYFVPELYKSIVLSGFHFHYINDTQTKGGHVFDFKFNEAKVSLQYCSELNVILPLTAQFDQMNINQDLDEALQVAEHGKANPKTIK